MGEDKGFNIEELSRAIAMELRKLNEMEKEKEKEKERAPATPGDIDNKPTWNCPECGEKLKGGEKYCPGCGVELEWES